MTDSLLFFDITEGQFQNLSQITLKPLLLLRLTTPWHVFYATIGLTVDGAVDTHDLKVRTSGGLYKMEIHIVVNGQLTVIEGHRIAKIVERRLADDIEDIDSVIVHVDPAIEKNAGAMGIK